MITRDEVGGTFTLGKLYISWIKMGWKDNRLELVNLFWGKKFIFQLKTPHAMTFFSERYGYRRPAASIGGWRLFTRS